MPREGGRDHLVLVPVHLRGRIVPNYAMIDHDRHIPFWRAWEKRFTCDCRFILQLSHGGRQRDIQGVEYPVGPVRPDSATPATGSREAMTTRRDPRDSGRLCRGRAARREAGLDGVELHGANGYLITQSELPRSTIARTNDRRPARESGPFRLDIVRAIRKKVGSDFHLQMKISVQEHCDAVSFFNIGPPATPPPSRCRCKWLVRRESMR